MRFIVFSCLIAQAFSACFTPQNFNCRDFTGTFPDPRDCGQSFVQCPNPQAPRTGQATSCGRGSWFDPLVCNCSPGAPSRSERCALIRGGGGGGFQQQQTQSRPQSRPQSSGNFGGSNFGGSNFGVSNSNSGGCRFTGCQGVRDSVRVYPDPNNSFGFIQCDGNGRAVRQQCNGIRFNLQTCNC
jgi:hypothetical protein